MLATAGGGPVAVGSRVAGAFLLALALHTAVLVAGTAALRAWTGLRESRVPTAPETR